MVRKSIFYFENAVYFASEILTLHLHFFSLLQFKVIGLKQTTFYFSWNINWIEW